MESSFIEKYLERILKSTHLNGIGELKVGKVRDIYTQPNRIILVSTDRHSSFDRVIAHVPFKGQVLNQVAAFWFEQTKDIIPNHVLAIPDPNVTVAKKCKPLPIEVVVRGYITGITSTSLWTAYVAGKRDFGHFTLPDGMVKNQKLDTPIITPTTKSDEHDKNLTEKEIVEQGLLTQPVLDKVKEAALKLFKRGQDIAFTAGLILVDTKYEFGLDDRNNLILIDEIHTPDSSRFWLKETYQEKLAKREEPDYYDKEFLRLWFKEHCDPYKDEVLPEAPKELIVEMSRRYVDVYERLTDKKFIADLDGFIEDRIANNLVKYHV